MAAETPSAQTILYVCSTCRAGVAPIEGQPVAGARLLAALQVAQEASSVDAEDRPRPVIRAVECLSACSRGCAIALARPGSWTYIYGNLSEADVADILLGAQGYIASADGIPPCVNALLFSASNALPVFLHRRLHHEHSCQNSRYGCHWLSGGRKNHPYPPSAAKPRRAQAGRAGERIRHGGCGRRNPAGLCG
uniref:DUF1636 family protein n=1 Tax=Acetobacter papayae TaxID=1076592 RepID=UPI001F3725E8|nr:DUF1636 domain-containing protein [Acetobacter papayae]